MQTWPQERGCHTLLRLPAKKFATNNGILLALDGRCLERQAIPRALPLCRQIGKRLDILLMNPQKPATMILGKLLPLLEMEGIDYRLTSGEGDLAVEIPLYLRRFRAISVVLMDCLDQWEAILHPTLDALRRDGYQVLTLLDRENDLLPAAPSGDWRDGH